jgi:hypothetical protein
MHTQTQSPDVAPVQSPRIPTSIVTTGPDGKPHTLPIPLTRADVRELTARRSAISDQLGNVSSRRTDLAKEISTTPDAASRVGLEDRLRLLDSRILQLETDLATTGQQLSAAPTGLLSETSESQSPPEEEFMEGVLAGGFSVLAAASILVFLLRRRWKRRSKAAPQSAGVESGRLERLENGMEAIAIEIERISEGQRFVTKLLSGAQPSLDPQHRIAQTARSEPDPAKAS